MFDRISPSASTPPSAPVEPTPASPRFSRRQLLAAGLGTLTVATAGTAAIWGAKDTRSEDVIDSGHVRRILLVSGVMYASRYSGVHSEERQPVQWVHLTRGQFAFHLQHDSGQSTRVTTTLCEIFSTAAAEFAVTLSEAVSASTVMVTVARGVIELLPTAQPNPSGLILKAGQKLILRAGLSLPQPLTVADPQHDLAWTKGTLFFKGESISEAALSFNRFNDRRIIVSPSIADVSVGSVIVPLNNPHRFVDRFVAAWPDKVRKEVRGKLIYLSEK